MSFDIIYQGVINSVRLIFEPTELERTVEEKQFIDKIWEKEKTDSTIYNGPMFGVKGHEFSNGVMSIRGCRSSYREFVGTRTSFVEKFGFKSIVNPLSVGCLIISIDNKIIFGRRSGNVDLAKYKITVPSGWVDPTQDLVNNEIDVVAVVKREIKEELGIFPVEISNIRCLGLIFNHTSRQTFLPFCGVTTLNFKEILTRARDGEFSEILGFENIDEILLRDDLSDVAKPTLEFYKRHVKV